MVELGFVAQPQPALDDHALHARPYRRDRDGASVDLHRTLHGLQSVPVERAWQAVATNTAIMTVGRLGVEVPGIPVRLLHLVLHVAPGEPRTSQAWRDLERGILRVGLEEWRAAVALARELGVEQEMGVRLRRHPDGARLADELGVTHRGSRYYRLTEALNTGRAPRSVLSLWGLLSLPDAASRLAYARGKLLPDEQTLLERSRLARHGHLGLARAVNVARVLVQLPATLLAWTRHYRE
jgi:hypothetical protein